MQSKRRPGRPRQPVERDHLLAVARAAFARHGYTGASMQVIAERAGIRKSSLFHHFPTKASLYDAVFDQLLGDLARLIAVPTPGASWPEQLDDLARVVVRYLGGTPDAARLLMREIVGGGPVVEGPGWQAVLRLQQATAAFLELGMEREAIPRQDARQLALSVIGLLLTWFAAGNLTAELLGADPFDPDQVLAREQAVVTQIRRLVGAPVSASEADAEA